MPVETPNLSAVRVLIFDLDGTLIDSCQDLANAVNTMRAQLHLPPHSRERVMSYIGHGARELVRKSISDTHPSPPDDFLDTALGYFRGHYAQHLLEHTRPYPGVRETIERLARDADSNYTLAVLTNKPLRFTLPILEGLDLTRFFRFIYGEDSFPTKKPDPAGVQSILHDTGASTRQALLVGDSDTDILTARNAGIWVAGVTYGLGSHLLADFPPDFLLENFSELPALLNGR